VTETGPGPLVAVPDYLDEVLPYAHLRAEVEAQGGRLELWRCQTQAEVVARCSEAVALVVHWFPFDGALLAALPKLQLVVRYGVGYEVIDADAARELGVIVCNTPRFCTDDVADHTMALLLALARKLKALTRNAECGLWDRDETGRLDRRRFRRLRGHTLGLIGFGQIGQAVAARAQGFGLRVLACDPLVEPAQAGFPEVVRATLEQVLADADFLSIHAGSG
jgi:D-3-phosphoglycerate dehydrogenase